MIEESVTAKSVRVAEGKADGIENNGYEKVRLNVRKGVTTSEKKVGGGCRSERCGGIRKKGIDNEIN